MTTKEEYKFFIENCTSTPKSYKNYSDFSRVCKTLARIKGIESFDMYSCNNAEDMENNIRLLEADGEFVEYNKKGGNQYSNALSSYLRFLKANQFFKQEQNYGEASSTIPLQQIFYGAPGTGKSHTIKDCTKGKDVIRTTFHPDSDYSTFVGAYKPTTKEVPVYSTFGEKVVVAKDAEGKPIVEDKIVYEFVEQAFLQAYIEAWTKFAEAQDGEQPKEQYLIIEEINRGNCAQIFGDLFQLLDRNDAGFSDYPIKADNDMAKHLKKALEKLEIKAKDKINGLYSEEYDDIVTEVLNGKVLLLPNNLFIWATMNTSDQSLFPIDSAFKRRWEWKYIPISNAKKGWVIETNGNRYDWWAFLNKINSVVCDTTSSEDKKLGYFFAKADSNGVISADKFIGKVAFYLWNDVFKDYGFDNDIFKGDDGKPIAFQEFFLADGKANEMMVEKFLKNLGLDSIDNKPSDSPQVDDENN